MVTWSQQETPACRLAITHPRDVTAEEGLVVMLPLVHFWGFPAGPGLKPGWTWGLHPLSSPISPPGSAHRHESAAGL